MGGTQSQRICQPNITLERTSQPLISGPQILMDSIQPLKTMELGSNCNKQPSHVTRLSNQGFRMIIG